MIPCRTGGLIQLLGGDGESMQRHLSHPREVNGFAENASSFLRRMETGRILSFDEVQVKLCPALMSSGCCKFTIGGTI